MSPFSTQERFAAYLVVFIIFCLSMILFSQSSVVEGFRSDIKRNVEHCHAQKYADESQNTKECQGLFYKTIDDPVALFTGGLFVFTMLLAAYTYRLFRVTKDGIAEQADLTRKALVADNRAWLKVELVEGQHCGLLKIRDGLHASVHLKITNEGKGPALNINTFAFLFVDTGAVEFTKWQKRKCEEVRIGDWSRLENRLLLPGEHHPTQGVDGRNCTPVPWAVVETAFSYAEKYSLPGIAIRIVGCVNYRFPNDGGVVHQTRFAFCIEGSAGDNLKREEIGEVDPASLEGFVEFAASSVRVARYPTGIGQHFD